MSDLDPRLVKAEPTGKHTSYGFWDGTDELGGHIGGYGPLEVTDYHISAEAEALRRLRVELSISLHQAARLFGLTGVELSGLEHGRYVPKDSALWALLMAKLETHRR